MKGENGRLKERKKKERRKEIKGRSVGIRRTKNNTGLMVVT